MSDKRGVLIVLVGPSGVGKSTISRAISGRSRIRYTVSYTTRPRAEQDSQGKAYHHITRDEFFRKLDEDAFLEYAQVYDEYYGTPKRPVLDELKQGLDVLLEIDVQGALQVRFQYPEALTIFVLPPDENTLLQRLRSRGRDTPDAIQKRFRAAKREIAMAKGSRAFDYMVINDDLESAVETIMKIIRHKREGGI